MALVTMKTLLEQAQAEHRGVGAFSVGNMEMVKGAVQAAEELGTPIILQIAEVRLKHSPLHLMGPMMVQAAKEAEVDIAVHLDHGLTIGTVRQALELGFTSVMYDSSTHPFEENIKRTREVAELAKAYGATVEAELGLVGGSEDGSCDHGIRCTDPEDAKAFCLKIRFCPLRQLVETCRRNIHLHDSKGNRASEISVCNPASAVQYQRNLRLLINLF